VSCLLGVLVIDGSGGIGVGCCCASEARLVSRLGCRKGGRGKYNGGTLGGGGSVVPAAHPRVCHGIDNTSCGSGTSARGSGRKMYALGNQGQTYGKRGSCMGMFRGAVER
jgi:hypothetical protein